ncbi:MAG TPA: 2-dehydropantoate 2-reductase [Burkholderiaceae bacterium]|nr:2-dehydropantoate 2-reductase [Burkholderiaceae bacterium]
MKIAVVGLGAVGGLIAARLAMAEFEVCALTRGATLAAVRAHGLRLVAGGEEKVARIAASDDARTLGPQDLVIVALKGPALAAAAASLQPLLGSQTIVMPAMNGVPWWFLDAAPADAALGDRHLASIDPDGRIGAALPLARVLGCVVHLTCSSPEPGLVRHGFGDRLIVGEPGGGPSARVDMVRAALGHAGFQAEASTDIRQAIWYKLWGNMTMNPVSALTGAESHHIIDDPLVLAFMLGTMEEARRIGARIGCVIEQSGEERMAVARELGAFKTSMLQDCLAGRPLELDALVGAVHEIGTRLGVAMPNIGALLGLTRLMARERGLYPPAA